MNVEYRTAGGTGSSLGCVSARRTTVIASSAMVASRCRQPIGSGMRLREHLHHGIDHALAREAEVTQQIAGRRRFTEAIDTDHRARATEHLRHRSDAPA